MFIFAKFFRHVIYDKFLFSTVEIFFSNSYFHISDSSETNILDTLNPITIRYPPYPRKFKFYQFPSK